MVRNFISSLLAALTITFVLTFPAARSEAGTLRILEDLQYDNLSEDGQVNPEPAIKSESVSPDGTRLVHQGAEYPPNIYIKELASGKDRLIVKGNDDWPMFRSLAFSPDGARILFQTSHGDESGRAEGIYSVRNDGTDLRTLAEGKILRNSEDGQIRLWDPVYSPDGTKIAVQVSVVGGKHPGGYIGILSPDRQHQTPRKMLEAIPRFWSVDGAGFYYVGRNGYCRYDLATGHSEAVETDMVIDRLGRVPGANAVFGTKSARDCSSPRLDVFMLDGSRVTATLKAVAEKTPVESLHHGRGIGKGSAIVFSPDHALRAYADEHWGLFVENLKTSQTNLILDDVDGWGMGMFGLYDVEFSPDGRRILFSICPPLGAGCHGPRVYTVKPDGSDLVQLADSDYDKDSGSELNIRSTMYSPDGRYVLFMIESYREEVYEDEDNEGQYIREPIVHNYVGVLPADAVEEFPAMLAEGEPEFWSTDSKAVYFARNGLCKLELESQRITPVQLNVLMERDELGRVPGTDAIFVRRHHSDCRKAFDSVDVVRLDGRPMTESLERLAASIPSVDSNGRRLMRIRAAGPRHLVLNYFKERSTGDIKAPPSRHLELVTWDPL